MHEHFMLRTSIHTVYSYLAVLPDYQGISRFAYDYSALLKQSFCNIHDCGNVIVNVKLHRPSAILYLLTQGQCSVTNILDIFCSENLCSNTGTNLRHLSGCDKLIDLVLCGGSASVPRGVVTRFITISPSATSIVLSNCFDGQLVDHMGASPVCDSDIPDTPYM